MRSLYDVRQPILGEELTKREDTREKQRIGRFQLHSSLGQGGFGTVYRAFDPVLDREVALKVPRFDFSDKDLLARFTREAKAAARLRHPNIVAVYESGQEAGVGYIATEFVDGKPLSGHLKAGQLPLRRAVTWTRELALALAYAHEGGVIHRDIKPDNIMIDAEGRPQLMDFGLAKRQNEDVEMTTEGSIFGTPAYMAPEQARGEVHEVGPHSDQYSLGAVLYELLTHRRPFEGKITSVILSVSNEAIDPPSPRSIRARIPADLEAICLKAIAKDPARRYADMNAFAEDLRRWLAGEPVVARPVSSYERLWRWCRRNRQVASLMAAVAGLLVIGAVGATIAAIAFQGLAQDEKSARYEAEETLADLCTNSGIASGASGMSAQASLWFANAAIRAEHDSERQIYNRLRFRNWNRDSWLPWAAFEHAGKGIKRLRLHSSGDYLSVTTSDGACSVWDLTTESAVELPSSLQGCHAAAWSHDGSRLAAADSEAIEVVQFPGGEPIFVASHTGQVHELAFGPNGRYLVVAGEVTKVLDLQQTPVRVQVLDHPQPVSKLSFDVTGQRLATACMDGKARVFQLGTDPSPLIEAKAHFGYGAVPARPLFVDQGRSLITLADPKTVVWWNLSDGSESTRYVAKEVVLELSLSHDRELLALSGYRFAQLVDAQRAEAIGSHMAHDNFVYDAVFSPHEPELVTVSADRRVRWWSTETGERLPGVVVHQQEVVAAEMMSRDRGRLVTAQIDGLVRVWKREGRPPLVQTPLGDAAESFLNLDVTGRFAVKSGWTFQRAQFAVQALDLVTGEPHGAIIESEGVINACALGAGAKYMVTASAKPGNNGRAIEAEALIEEGGRIEVWDATSGERLLPPLETPSEPLGVAVSPDDSLVAALCAGGQLRVFDRATGAMRAQRQLEASVTPRYVVRDWIRFTPDGKGLIAWLDASAWFWDTEDFEQSWAVTHEGLIHDVRFSIDGRRFVTVSMDGDARVWDAERLEEIGAALHHPDWVFHAAFSPDGERLLTACRDGMARYWDIRSGELVCPALVHEDEVYSVAIPADERVLLTGSKDGKLILWEWRTGKPVAPVVPLPGMIYSLAIAADDEHVVVTGQIGGMYRLSLRDAVAVVSARIRPESLRLLGELASGQRVHAGGGVVNLSSQEWLLRWHRLRERVPEYRQGFPTEEWRLEG